MDKGGAIIFRTGGTVVDSYSGASDFNTDSIDLSNFDGQWIAYFGSTHSQGTPTVTIQISDDDSEWFDYYENITDEPIPVSVGQSSFLPRFIRVAYTANSSNGNVTFKFVRL